MEIYESSPSAPKNLASLNQAIDDTWGPKAGQPSTDRGQVVLSAHNDAPNDPHEQNGPSRGDIGPPSTVPPGLESQPNWSPLPADASPELVQKDMERLAGELATQIGKDHFAGPTQEKVAEFMERFAENPGAAIDLINKNLAKDGLYLNYEDDPEHLSKEYTGKMLKEGTFQNDIIGAVTLYDTKTGKDFPDPLILLGNIKPHYDI